MRELRVRSRCYMRARVHINNDEEFVNDIILNRDKATYPDPNVRNINDIDLLKNYLCRVLNAVRGYNSKDDNDCIEEFVNKERKRINGRIGKLKYPSPTKYGLSICFEEIDNADFNTGYMLPERNIDWNIFEKLFNLPINELRYLSGYYKSRDIYKNKMDKMERIINAFRYVKGDSTVDLENIINFTPINDVKENIVITKDGEELEIEEGIPFSDIKSRIEDKKEIFDNDFMFALTIASVEKITNYHHKSIPNGEYYPHTTNYSENMEDDDTSIIQRDVVAHELFHAFQDITLTRDMNASDAVDIDKEPHNWENITFKEPNREDIKRIQDKMMQIWFKFRRNPENKLCEYQTKNITDMVAVGFEAYCTDKKVLNKKQPELYEYIENILCL